MMCNVKMLIFICITQTSKTTNKTTFLNLNVSCMMCIASVHHVVDEFKLLLYTIELML